MQAVENCRTLIGALKSRTTPEQEQTYCMLLDKRDVAGVAANRTDKLDLTNVFCDDEGRLPLEDAKRLVLKNMRILEVGIILGSTYRVNMYIFQVAGYTSSKDGCHSIINDLAKDILNQRDHRSVAFSQLATFTFLIDSREELSSPRPAE